MNEAEATTELVRLIARKLSGLSHTQLLDEFNIKIREHGSAVKAVEAIQKKGL